MQKESIYQTLKICICKFDTDIITASERKDGGDFNLNWLDDFIIEE